jgi:ribonuclease P protein component
MLHKSNRLAKAKDIQMAFARGRTFFSPFFTVKFLAKPGAKLFTVVVSTKVFKKANRRNRLKRIIRERVRKNLESFKPGYYMVIAKPKIAALLEKDIIPAFLQAVSKVK